MKEEVRGDGGGNGVLSTHRAGGEAAGPNSLRPEHFTHSRASPPCSLLQGEDRHYSCAMQKEA